MLIVIFIEVVPSRVPPTGRRQNPLQGLQALANRWLDLLWDLLRKRVLYHETVHQANRSKPQVAAWAA